MVYKNCYSKFYELFYNCIWVEKEVQIDRCFPELSPQNFDDFWCCQVDAFVVDTDTGFAIFQKNYARELEEVWVVVGCSVLYSFRLCGIALALQVARDKQVSKLRIETDSKVVALAFGVGSLSFRCWTRVIKVKNVGLLKEVAP
ncbi:uncharacterized protein LOC133039140 [Cannabis sativa]|uniref:uncharacterized protein LOC133039140 n=1 Tax=Cannabis sativa TaxID=3483 RepID=UPI0029CA6F55|nr:uncharacterized protein LOC133039140 [Cannabis sativa]